MPQSILIDTDAGDDIDDLFAIAFALLRPELTVESITTVSSLSARRALLIQRLLDSARKSAIPVAAGCELPLRPVTEAERAMVAEAYRSNHAPAGDEQAEAALAATDAVSTIIETVNRRPGEVGIVAIGPLTNIAAALVRRADLASKIPYIALMGGEVVLTRAEHNISWDPEAAAIVLSAGVPIFLGTWDVTRRFVLLPEDLEAFRKSTAPLHRMLIESLDLWWPHRGGKPGPVMYDLAPIAWSMDRSLYATQPMTIAVETQGAHTRGWTVRVPGPANADVSVDMRADDVKALYLETLLGTH